MAYTSSGGDGRYGDPYVDSWDNSANTGSYVGVPDAYKAQVGERFDPSKVNYPGYSTTANIYAQPHYHNSEIDALWGKPAGVVAKWQMKAWALGFLPSFVPGTMDDKSREGLMKAMAVANKNGLTLDEMLQRRNLVLGGQPGGKNGSRGNGPGGGGPSTSTSTSTMRSISLTSREGAYAVLANALGQELGRNPTQAELTRFTHALNAKERANPTVTSQSSTTTTSGTHSSTSGTSTSKQGNVDTGYQATQFGKTGALAPEFSKFQDSQYMDVISQMIGAK